MVWFLLCGVVGCGVGGACGRWRARFAVSRDPLVAVVWWLACVVLFGLGSGLFSSAFAVGVGFRSSSWGAGLAVCEWALVALRVSGWGRWWVFVGHWWRVVGLSCGGWIAGGVGVVIGGAVVGSRCGWWLTLCGWRLVVWCVGPLLSRGVCGWAVGGCGLKMSRALAFCGRMKKKDG